MTDLRALLAAATPNGTRLVRMADDILATWGTRTERGDRITAEWGEPDEWGIYEPTLTIHRDHTAEAREAVIEAARFHLRHGKTPGDDFNMDHIELRAALDALEANHD